jgi:ADP-heptose:LPS heptosyltransferase
MKILVKNYDNNMGDAMCQMRGLKEYKDANPDISLDFATCHYLHWVVANHTNLFDNIYFLPDAQSVKNMGGYDKDITFTVDWSEACMIGILKAWTKKTLNFIPSTDKPYFILTEQEKLSAKMQLRQIIYSNYITEEQSVKRFRKSVIVQPEAVSDPRRSFQREDWERFFNLFPDDVAVIYFCPMFRHFYPELIPHKDNIIVLPGYGLGESAAMMQLVDCVFTVHSGTVMLAKAVEAKPIVQINFLEASSVNICTIPDGTNIPFQTNREVDWNKLKAEVVKYLG